jgi:hypothetical protein
MHEMEQCFIQQVDLHTPSEQYLFADCESSISAQGRHEVGMVITQNWTGKQVEHRTAKEFVEWLLKEQKGKTVVMHNGGAYDYVLMYNTRKSAYTQGRNVKPNW